MFNLIYRLWVKLRGITLKDPVVVEKSVKSLSDEVGLGHEEGIPSIIEIKKLLWSRWCCGQPMYKVGTWHRNKYRPKYHDVGRDYHCCSHPDCSKVYTDIEYNWGTSRVYIRLDNF